MMRSKQTQPIVLTIAGSDSSGGAGIQADLKTFTALGVYGASVITALTAQNTNHVSAIHPVPAKFVAQQFKAVTQDLDVTAIKIGMLATADVAKTIADCLKSTNTPIIVLDPVMVATSGDPLIDGNTVTILKTQLFPLATLVTPNRAEAAKLTSSQPFETLDEAKDQARKILDLGCRAVLLKGGHANSDMATDVFATVQETKTFDLPRINTTNTHGTGCTLSSAIATHLARGLDLPNAVEAGKSYVWHALNAARSRTIGNGNGPLDHMFAQRPKNN